MTSNLVPLDAFDISIANEFLTWVQKPEHKNRYRLTYEQKMTYINGCLRQETLKGKRVRQTVQAYLVENGQLYRKPENGQEKRQVVLINDTLQSIERAHLRLNHAGYHKTYAEVDATCYGITRDEVKWVLARCRNCTQNRPANTQPPLHPIEVNYTFKRVQIDLIDMGSESDGQYKWILHA